MATGWGRMFRIGIDIGGTFTDFAVWRREADGYVDLASHKLPTSAPDYASAVIEGIAAIAREHGLQRDDEILVVHGTTITTNAIIERSQPPVALLTTAGYRDILEIARLRLDKPVDLFNRRPPPLTPRRYVWEIAERMRADGSVDRPLDSASVLAAADAVREAGIDTVAIAFLHAWRNPAHEAEAAAMLREAMPGATVMASHEVWPQKSEYERATLTLLNLYVKRLMARYLGEIEDYLRTNYPRSRLLITKSNGGAMSAAEARELPVHTLLSGPSAGVTGARVLGGMLGESAILTMDMGGTSTDVAVVRGTEASVTAQAEVGDFPLVLPVTAIEALGAGGGSLVVLDAGVLKVGPRSAGARPGPASYGFGGTVPTLTDAYVVTNLLPPEGLLGGRLPLHRDRAEEAFAPIARDLGVTPDAVADAAIAVATSNMLARTLPFLARIGIAPSELTLMIFGGAGGLHGPLLAAELGLSRILVPRLPSVFCAMGCLVADLVHDAIRTVRGERMSGDALAAAFAALAQEGRDWLAAQGGGAAEQRFLADMRYRAQAFTVPVDVTRCVAARAGADDYAEAFHAEHDRLFGHRDEAAAVAIDELRVRTIGRQPKPHAEPGTAAAAGPAEPYRRRDIRIAGTVHAAAPVYLRAMLAPGSVIHGPAIIEQDVATVLVPLGYTACAGALGDLVLSRE